ncbi:MAG: ABC-F family ATP-binding cassette domain-containing protein [Elusimicrobia bacterium]|nr:ABC-F family ATP-binding cassette domain-containing protein [Elusimicrobiota bacterium]
MDEPTTHLDMPSVDALIGALKEFEGTICCISHDLYFLNALADHVLHIDRGKVTLYPGDYEYFKRRQDQWREENPQAVEVPVLEKAKPAAADPPDPRKQAKRLAKLEGELLELHIRLEELAGRLADPELYADYAKVQAVGTEMERVQQAIQEKEAEADKLR